MGKNKNADLVHDLITAVMAGFWICIGAAVYLKIGGITGAALFSVGLATVLVFGLCLFTGKAGLLVSREISLDRLFLIWMCNCTGVGICAELLKMTPLHADLTAEAARILEIRCGNTWLENAVLGVICGVLMYAAVTGYRKTKSFLYMALPVVVFITLGCNHCVADMAYLALGADAYGEFVSLIPTTIGNVIGCNLMPAAIKLDRVFTERK